MISTYYMGEDGITCVAKPSGAVEDTDGTELRTMQTEKGVFRFTEKSTEIYMVC